MLPRVRVLRCTPLVLHRGYSGMRIGPPLRRGLSSGGRAGVGGRGEGEVQREGGGGDEEKYLEQLQRRFILSPNHYEEEGKQRRYYYYVDLQGRLFIEEVVPKNITSCLKSSKFLDFFFHNLRLNPRPEIPRHSHGGTYPFISPCGNEMNYIMCADTPLVFTSIRCDGDGEGRGRESKLLWGGEREETFQPHLLAMSPSSNRLYHPITRRNKFSMMCLVQSHIAIELCRNLIPCPDSDSGLSFHWEGQVFPLRLLTEEEDRRRRGYNCFDQ